MVWTVLFVLKWHTAIMCLLKQMMDDSHWHANLRMNGKCLSNYSVERCDRSPSSLCGRLFCYDASAAQSQI